MDKSKANTMKCSKWRRSHRKQYNAYLREYRKRKKEEQEPQQI